MRTDLVGVRFGLISSQAFSIHNFRGPLIRELTSRGVKVYALAPDYDKITRQAVAALGAEPVDYSLERAGMRPFLDVVDLLRLAVVLRRLRLDVTLGYFIKPVIYGSLAAWLANVPRIFSMIEGLGYVFNSEEKGTDLKRRLLRVVVSWLYRWSLSQNKKVFFLNNEDIYIFVSGGVIEKSKVVHIHGIGVDLDHFSVALSVSQPVTFLFLARLLREKGIYEYIEAARLVKAIYPQVRFLLVGGVDTNPGSTNESELRAWVDEGLIEWPGQVADVRPWIEQSSVFVLPSYYREGVPRGNQEAMAMGRPVITTDWVGCRETVQDGVNGFLVPVRDPEALARAMCRFIDSPNLILKMGQEGRRIAEQKFNVHNINATILEAMALKGDIPDRDA